LWRQFIVASSTRAPLFAHGFQSTFVNTDFEYQLNGSTADGSVVYAPWSVETYAVLTPASVPEPTSLGLLGIGATALLGRRRRVV
jgi:carbohydrate-binding DOMON domain-containing protein